MELFSNITRMTPEALKQHVRTVTDWPKPGVNFRDVTPLFQDPTCFRAIIDWLVGLAKDLSIDRVAGVDARGFILAGAVAYQMNLPLALVRKKGKLPAETIEETYDLEYGSATVEIHKDAAEGSRRLLLLDDLIATGGTLAASSRLFRRVGVGEIVMAAVIDLPELGGRRLLEEQGNAVHALLAFTEDE